ncbi:MAG TPA: SDR family NAD(P)-dependent oxidoreductase [Rhodanobacteraceae bacterium]
MLDRHACNTATMATTESVDLHGKTIVITGATSGIGRAAALALAQRGADVVITGRDTARIDATLATLRAQGAARAVGLRADFSRRADVHRLAGEILQHCPRIDVLVNNAGSVNARRTLTTDGIETTFAVNHLAPFLLTNLLLKRLGASAPARIVNVASVAHTRGTLDFDDINFDHGYTTLRAYARSKLANVLFTRALAKRIADTGVTVNAVHPGAVATGIWRHGVANPVGAWTLSQLARLCMRTPERGAATVVYAATSPDLAGKMGLYLEKNRPTAPSALACDEALAERLWATSARLTQLAAPEPYASPRTNRPENA